jgi:N-acetyl-anhydromuramyl-L-alanine amidase AmpD
MSENSSIIVCDQRFDVGRRVITFQEDPKISAYTLHCVTHDGIYPTSPAKGLGTVAYRYRARRMIGADRSLGRLQQVLKQFVIHHDGMGTSRDCFRVLHDERGLSVHFLIDNNGDIYQTLDLVECGFQAAGVNEISIGVELCNRGDAQQFPEFYDKAFYRQWPRNKVTCTINSHQWLCYDYTKEQLESMTALGRSLARIFPGLPQVAPMDSSGEPLWDTLAGDPRDFAGYLGHYHVTNQKWDPGPFDFKKFIQSIRGRMFFPAIRGRDKPELADDGNDADAMAKVAYQINEEYSVEGGGYFPIGPAGPKGEAETLIWHGGSHLRDTDRGKPVVSPFPGKIVLARMKKEDDWPNYGSPNFVLIRHEMAMNGTQIKFFTLLFHLDQEVGAEKWPQWMKSGKEKKWFAPLQNGEVTILEQSVAAGETIGHMGEAGRKGAWAPQIHFEIFSVDEIGAQVDAGFWKTYDGTHGKRFCRIPDIINPINVAPKDGLLTNSEIVSFFKKNRGREAFRKMAVRHVSEWGDRNGDWEAALRTAPEYVQSGYKAPQIHKIYTQQIEPMLWWGDDLTSLGLPADKIVWSYHPITFVLWLHKQLKSAASANAKAIGSASSFSGTKPPPDIKDDATATDGFMDDEDALFGEAAKSLDLEKLSEGFPD